MRRLLCLSLTLLITGAAIASSAEAMSTASISEEPITTVFTPAWLCKLEVTQVAAHSTITLSLMHAHAAGDAEIMAIPEWVVKLIKAAVDQVLKAMNLALMRLQNKNIDLMNIAKAAESIIHAEGMQKLMDTGKKMKELHEKYYDDLKRVKDAIVTIATVRDLVETQKDFMADYQRIIEMINTGTIFSPDEIDYITRASAAILDNALKNIDDVNSIIESFKTDMTDADRLILVKNMRNRIDRDKISMEQLKNNVTAIVLMRSNPQEDNIRLFFNK
jgi:hypothetical protein